MLAMCTLLNSPSLICYIHCLCFRRLKIKKNSEVGANTQTFGVIAL